MQRIGGADLQAGDAHVGAKLTRQAREEIAAADIREIADADFRHAHAHALGDHPQRRALDQAHAAAEDETVHQRQQWFRVGMDVLVEGVFLLEEGFVLGVAALEAVVQRTDVTAGAEGFFAIGAQYHGMDLRIGSPGAELLVQQADHFQGHRIQPGRAVEGEVADVVAYGGQHGAFGCTHGQVSLRY